MTDFHIRSTCRLCASPDLERLLMLNDTPLANELSDKPERTECVVRADDPRDPKELLHRADRFPLHLVGCRVCGHVQLPVVVDPKRLFGPDYPYQSGTSAVFREHLRELAHTVAGEIPMGSGVLDIACNDGTLVGMLGDLGLRAFGIDPAASGEPGLIREFFTEQWAKGYVAGADTVSCVTMLNAFAHIDDLDDIVRGVKRLLEPGGLFVVEVGYIADVVAAGRFTTAYHEHMSYHAVSPLVPFFARHGMTLTDAERIESQGGSIRLFVRNAPDQEQSARLLDLLTEEDRDALWQGVRDLERSVEEAKAQLEANAPLVCYGAPAKLTTLLHATGQTGAVEYVVDANPLKQGRFVPGTRIPILAPSVLYERRPRRILVTAWNFYESIRAQHAELGCEWVVAKG